MILLSRGDRPFLVGCVHLLPLPGSTVGASAAEAVERAGSDAAALAEGGCDAVIVENFHDAPFFKEDVPAETVAGITACALAAREAGLPIGINVLRNDVRAALGIAAVTEAAFVRANVLAGAVIADQGLIEGRAAEWARARAALCPGVVILADVAVKHAAPLAPRPPAEEARDLVLRAGAGGLIVTGPATGAPPVLGDLEAVREAASGHPVFVGSGTTPENARPLAAAADGAIVGSWLHRDGVLDAPVDLDRVRRIRDALD